MALLATALWAGNFVLARGLRDDIPPVALTFWRWTIATVVLAPFAARATWEARGALRHRLGYVTLTGLLGVTVFNALVYQAGHTTEALNLALIAACAPAVIVLLAHVSADEPITRARAWGLVIAAAGVVVLVTDGSVERLASLRIAPGDVLMLAATAVFAVYTLLVRRKPATIGVTPFVFATFAIGVILLLPAYLVELAATGPFTLDGPSLAALAYIGTGPSLVAFYAWNKAIALIGASRPAVIYYLVPVFAGLAAWPLLGEPITGVDAASIALVIAGVALGTRRAAPAPTPRRPRA